MTDLNDGPATWYEYFLLRELQRDENKPEIRHVDGRDDIAEHVGYLLYRHISWERGLTDAQLMAIYDRTTTAWEWVFEDGLATEKREYQKRLFAPPTDKEKAWISSHPRELGGYHKGEWRWFKIPPASVEVSGEVVSNTYNPRLGRKVLLGTPQLELEEHQSLADQIRGLWTILLDCRQCYKSSETGYRLLNETVKALKAVCGIMADELCDMLDIPEGSDTLYDRVEPATPKRTKKNDLPNIGSRLTEETHTQLATAIKELWSSFIMYRRRYEFKADLQRRIMSEAIEPLANLAHGMGKHSKIYRQVISNERPMENLKWRCV